MRNSAVWKALRILVLGGVIVFGAGIPQAVTLACKVNVDANCLCAVKCDAHCKCDVVCMC